MNDNLYNKQVIDNLAKDLLNWIKESEDRWFIKDWFILKEIPYSYHTGFCTKSKEFKEALEKARDIMEARLVKKLIDKGFATTGLQFLLKNVVGWKDASQVEVATVELDSKKLASIKDKYFKKK